MCVCVCVVGRGGVDQIQSLYWEPPLQYYVVGCEGSEFLTLRKRPVCCGDWGGGGVLVIMGSSYSVTIEVNSSQR